MIYALVCFDVSQLVSNSSCYLFNLWSTGIIGNATVNVQLIVILTKYGITKRRVSGRDYLDCFDELEGLANCGRHHSQEGNPELH